MNDINLSSAGLKPQRGMDTPWGRADLVESKTDDNTVLVVSTSSHGGIGVHIATHSIPEYFKKFAIYGETWAWFEEDCCWSAAALALPELFLDAQQSAEDTLRNWYPDAYAAHFGRMPLASESMVVRERERKIRLMNNFTVYAAWDETAWNVPIGHVYVRGRRSADNAEAGFLIPVDLYKPPIDDIVLDAFPRWEPDRALPQFKPKGPTRSASA